MIQREIAAKYQGLFDLMFNEHEVILLEHQMDEIITEALKVIENFKEKPVCSTCQFKHDHTSIPKECNTCGFYDNHKLRT